MRLLLLMWLGMTALIVCDKMGTFRDKLIAITLVHEKLKAPEVRTNNKTSTACINHVTFWGRADINFVGGVGGSLHLNARRAVLGDGAHQSESQSWTTIRRAHFINISTVAAPLHLNRMILIGDS